MDRITMRKIREVLRLKLDCGRPHREIPKTVPWCSNANRVMTGVEFLARLAAIICPPRYPLVRFAGVLASQRVALGGGTQTARGTRRMRRHTHRAVRADDTPFRPAQGEIRPHC